jgi:hypothetical protein
MRLGGTLALAATAALVGGCAARGGPAPTATLAPAAERATGAVTGVVVDAESERPISMVTLAAVDDRLRSLDASSDGAGRYRIEGLAPGTYRIVAYYGVEVLEWQAVRVRAGQDTVLDVAFGPGSPAAPPPGDAAAPAAEGAATGRATGAIEGAIHDGLSGESLPGAVVAAISPALREPMLAMADEGGRFHLPALPPGTYTLSTYYHLVSRGNIEVRRTNVAVHAGRITTIELVLDTKTE